MPQTRLSKVLLPLPECPREQEPLARCEAKVFHSQAKVVVGLPAVGHRGEAEDEFSGLGRLFAALAALPRHPRPYCPVISNWGDAVVTS